MTDKEKIREKIEKDFVYYDRASIGNNSPDLVAKRNLCHDLLTYIDSLSEEPTSEDLVEASKEWLRPQLDKSYANYGEVKIMELTHFDGYAMLDAIEFGAKWQKEKTMKDAIEREVQTDAGGYPYIDINVELYDYDNDVPLAKKGDKYKIVLIKE